MDFCIEDEVLIRLDFSPGLALTDLRTTWPCFQQVNRT